MKEADDGLLSFLTPTALPIERQDGSRREMRTTSYLVLVHRSLKLNFLLAGGVLSQFDKMSQSQVTFRAIPREVLL